MRLISGYINRKGLIVMIKYAYRHIVRAPSKTFFSLAVALFLTFMLGFVQGSISNLNAEIDRLYNETVVYGEVRLADDFMRTSRFAGDIISEAILQYVLEANFAADIYLEGGSTGFITTDLTNTYFNMTQLQIFFGAYCLTDLTHESVGFLGREDSFNMEVEFAPGHNANNFIAYETTPLITSQEIAARENLTPGDYAYIIYYEPALFREGAWQALPVFILGIHDGNGLPSIAREGAVLPLATQQEKFGEHMGYITLRFALDPGYNRYLPALEESFTQALRSIFTYPRRDRLLLDLWDQELRFGARPLMQHLAFLRLLFPIISIIVAVIGAGLAMLSALQTAKNAAILRMLGMPKQKTRVTLGLVQVAIITIGVFAGVLLTLVVGLSLNWIIVVPYFVGAFVGAVAGIILITNRSPLLMSQVKG